MNIPFSYVEDRESRSVDYWRTAAVLFVNGSRDNQKRWK
jgi:hypothetical protein